MGGSGRVVSGGPLGPAGNSTQTCTPLHPGESMSEGYLSVTNHSGGTLTIESMTLAAPRDIRLIGAFIVPLRRNVIGDTDGWPPPRHLLLPGVEWAKRHVPAGARVRPGEWVDPVIGLRIAPGHDKGSEDGQLIRYRDAAGHQYVLHTAIDATLQAGPKACPA
ncbi:MAG TPA: hypothetical protein VGG25_28160 [Streptosporangiaceae bacterium]